MGNSGRFITFEGIDGAGKSTHIDALADRLRQQGARVLVTREPGGTALAEKIRTLVLYDTMDVLCEALLVFAARRDHLVRLIEPALLRGEVVLCDRFTDSSFAYQGGGRGLDAGVLSVLEHWVQGGLSGPEGALRQPDLTLWFDLSPGAAARRLARAREPDRFEAQDQGFFARVAQGFETRAMADPQRFCRVDAGRERQTVWADVEMALRSRGWLA